MRKLKALRSGFGLNGIYGLGGRWEVMRRLELKGRDSAGGAYSGAPLCSKEALEQGRDQWEAWAGSQRG